MNMDKYPMDYWRLHRKLVHRFLKYAKYFRQATESLPEYQQAIAANDMVLHVKKEQEATAQHFGSAHTISLLTSSSEEVSDDIQEEEGVDGDEDSDED